MPLSRLQLRHNSRLDYNLLHYGEDFDKSIVELLHAHFSDTKATYLLKDCSVMFQEKKEAMNSTLSMCITKKKRKHYINAQHLYHTMLKRYPTSIGTSHYCSEYNVKQMWKGYTSQHGIDELIQDCKLKKGGYQATLFIISTIIKINFKLAFIYDCKEKTEIVLCLNYIFTSMTPKSIIDDQESGKMPRVAHWLSRINGTISCVIEGLLGREANENMQEDCDHYFTSVKENRVDIHTLLAGLHLVDSFIPCAQGD